MIRWLSDLFTSRHTTWLESEYHGLKQQIVDLKKMHAEEMACAIKERESLRDELQRTRLLISPGLQAVSLPHEQEEPAPVVSGYAGTPWQRVLQREIAAQEKQSTLSADAAKIAATLKEESHGGNEQRRSSAPQRESGAPS